MDHRQAARVVALVPAWNAESFIERTLESLARQTYSNLHVLISDDASTDATADICQRFVDTDSRFELLRQPENLGWVGNSNALLRAARADYLLFAFHDDVLLPEYISRCVAALEANPSAVVAHSDMVTYFQDHEPEIGRYTRLEGVTSRVERAKWVLWRQDHWFAPNRGVFRSEAAERIGGLKRHLAGEFSADWPWLVHMALLGESIRVPEVLVEKYYQKASLSRTWNHGLRHQLGAALSCAREIHNAHLTAKESLRLYATITLRCVSMVRRIGIGDVRVKG